MNERGRFYNIFKTNLKGQLLIPVNSTSSGPSPMTSSIGGPSPSGPSPMEHTPTSMESGESDDDDDDDDIDGPDATITMELDSYVKQMVWGYGIRWRRIGDLGFWRQYLMKNNTRRRRNEDSESSWNSTSNIISHSSDESTL